MSLPDRPNNRLASESQPILGSSIPSASSPDLRAPDYDGLLEACCALGGGPWSHFELLARQSIDSFPQEIIQLLSALGHIDLELNT